jgi:hypothetical protein
MCDSGYSLCSGLCVDTASDDANCGKCARPCPPSKHCAAGTCVKN